MKPRSLTSKPGLTSFAVAEKDHDLTKVRDLAISPDTTLLACLSWRKTPDERGFGILESWNLTTGQANAPVILKGVPTWPTFALDNHAAAAHTKKYRDDLQSALGSPLDERIYRVIE